MDSTLVTVTVLSMGMAAALSVIVWRLLRDERRRSEARVVALAAAATVLEDTLPSAGGSRRETSVASTVSRETDADLQLHPVDIRRPAPALFVEPERSSPWGNRLAVMTGLALVCASVVLFALATKARSALPSANTATAGAAASEPGGPRLELVSLRDTRDPFAQGVSSSGTAPNKPGALTITGLVQNPRSGSLLTRVAVTAYAFDEKGAFLASGRALIDVTSLAPGDASPFVVTVPVGDAVARYRIGFRTEDGRVIAHVDRRQQGPIAALEPGLGQLPRQGSELTHW